VAAGVIGPLAVLALLPLAVALPADGRRWFASLPLVYTTAAAVLVALVPAMQTLAETSRRDKMIVLIGLVALAAAYAGWRGRRAGDMLSEAGDPS
jgi:hypothetical protein